MIIENGVEGVRSEEMFGENTWGNDVLLGSCHGAGRRTSIANGIYQLPCV